MPSHRRLRVRAAARVLSAVAARDRLPTTAPHVALTYDDGPDPHHTPAVMAALAEQGATATFFVLLTRVRRFPAFVNELQAEGHEIALHGPDHRPLSDFSAVASRRRLFAAKAELEDVTQTAVRWFRPPYGLLTVSAAGAVRAAGMRTLLWNRTALDWADATPAARLLAATSETRAGDVLLAHDAHAGASDGAADGREPAFDRGVLTAEILGAFAEHGLHGRSAATVDRIA